MPFEADGGTAHRLHVERLAHPPDEGLAEGRAPRGDLVQGSVRAIASWRAWNRWGAGSTRRMLMSAGSSSFTRRSSEAGGTFVRMSRCATCASACTPASVRPAPYSSSSRTPVASRTARSISPGHGAGVLLNLPPAVARAGVFDRQLEAGHAAAHWSSSRGQGSIGRWALGAGRWALGGGLAAGGGRGAPRGGRGRSMPVNSRR